MDNLKKLVYPGRVIALGRDPGGQFNVVIYAVTGRSPSSRARKLVLESGVVWTKPTDREAVKKGNPDLLVYPAVVLGPGIAVSNGKQTPGIDILFGGSPVQALDQALENWSYEPDFPTFTPRISGCILATNRAALSVIRRSEDGGNVRSFFEFPILAGKAKMVSTYSGPNKDPLPSFWGEPLDLPIEASSAGETAEAVYGALAPSEKGEDYRVAVVSIYASVKDMGDYRLCIINQAERMIR